MSEILPTKLKQEPIVDAVFEFRFKSAAPVSMILPGVFFSKLVGEKSLSELPAAQIPKLVRDGDPNLQFAPTQQIQWDGFLISFSDRSLVIGCKLPYPGWTAFKVAIKSIIDILKTTQLVTEVERFSIKYIDFVENESIEEQVRLLNLSLIIANRQLTNNVFQCRIEIPEDNFIHIVQLVAGAQVTKPGESPKNGLIIDIDTICNFSALQLDVFVDELEKRLDELHLLNKKMFFDCLTDEAVSELGAEYE